ncbi:MAG: hypothetical protein HRU09_09970 [Oligoflexales bacterium]|nr:hypothetical protein [Oligoflexales bacterium]
MKNYFYVLLACSIISSISVGAEKVNDKQFAYLDASISNMEQMQCSSVEEVAEFNRLYLSTLSDGHLIDLIPAFDSDIEKLAAIFVDLQIWVQSWLKARDLLGQEIGEKVGARIWGKLWASLNSSVSTDFKAHIRGFRDLIKEEIDRELSNECLSSFSSIDNSHKDLKLSYAVARYQLARISFRCSERYRGMVAEFSEQVSQEFSLDEVREKLRSTKIDDLLKELNLPEAYKNIFVETNIKLIKNLLKDSSQSS